jgi:hypothetical protein
VPLGRRRAALLVGAVLVTALPVAAQAVAPHLTCGPRLQGRWEQVRVRAFQPVNGLPSQDTVTAYGVDLRSPRYVAATNGVRVQVSSSNGCDWRNGFALDPVASPAQPFVGTAATIVSVAELDGRALAAVQEGTGGLSRPHVVRETAQGWTTSDSGLPLQGSPRLLRTATDGRTAYLTVSPDASGGSDNGAGGGALPGLPAAPSATGLLYASRDGGATWALRTGADALPGGGAGLSALSVDSADPQVLYGLAGGRLVVSHDGGAAFTQAPGSGFTAVTAMTPGSVAAFTGTGRGVISFDGGRSFAPFGAPSGITSAAWRFGDSGLMVESSGVLRHVEPSDGSALAVPAPVRARPGSLTGDDGLQSSFHALAGHALLRYVDPVPPTPGLPRIAVGDTTVTPPRPGVVSPSERDLTLRVGTTGSADFSLDLPKNPTPLDLFFLVDVSGSMRDYIENLKHNIQKVVDRLDAAKVDLKVGVGTMGTAPAPGEAPYPDTYVFPPGYDATTRQVTPAPTYRKPRIYQLIRAVGDTGPSLRKAINSIQIETDPPPDPGSSGNYHEGQLLALEQMVTGSGVQTEQDRTAGLSTYSAVAPGQLAQFRANPDVRRIVVLASDEKFDAPYGTPTRPRSTNANPLLDYTRTLRILNGARVGVFGITAGSSESIDDMDVLARGTRTLSPPGGVSCGGDPEQVLRAGAPLVCSQDGDFSAIIGRVLAELSDVQDVTLRATPSPVLTALHATALRGLDVKRANQAPFGATVSCAGRLPGAYAFTVDALLRGYPVGTARVRVTCVGPQAAVPPVPLPPVPLRPPAAPAVQPPAPPPPPPPAAQPNPQPNPNVNPLAAGVTQEQQEAQLALALNELASRESEGEQLAMVDRRKREQVQAFGSLLAAMTVCAGLGLARLRARSVPEIRRAR